MSPYNPSIDDVFNLSSRTPEASPFRHPAVHPHRAFDHGRTAHSPESDVGYGTSYGSHDFGGHTLDMDILSNLVVKSNSIWRW